jgi:hypothetical protein
LVKEYRREIFLGNPIPPPFRSFTITTAEFWEEINPLRAKLEIPTCAFDNSSLNYILRNSNRTSLLIRLNESGMELTKGRSLFSPHKKSSPCPRFSKEASQQNHNSIKQHNI